MPRRTKTKSKLARVAGGKTIVKKTKTIPIAMNHHRKDMRFKISLVILIGMLSFSAMLLLLSLNRSSAVNAKTGMSATLPAKQISGIKKSSSQTLDDDTLDFKLAVPVGLGDWLYKVGEVKSLTDNSLSNQYLKIFVPLTEAKSNNFDRQNKDILMIRRFSSEEWSDIEKSCKKDNSDICAAAGKLISENDEWAYAFTKPEDCPKSIEAKCALADKIVESFNLK